MVGEEHRLTAQTFNVLGEVLQAQGEYAEARSAHERALAIRQKIQGEEHPDTATSLDNLAAMLVYQGKYAEARPLHERALAIYEKVLGKEHPDTATCLINLGGLLYVQGDYAEARSYLERALAIYENVLGKEHPNTAQTLINLAEVLQAQGEYAEARSAHERALMIYEKVLGKEHPRSKQVRQYLTVLYTQQNGLWNTEANMNNNSLSAQERIKLYADYLTEEGYKPQVDQELGGIFFKHQGKPLFILVDENDAAFFSFIFPLMPIDSPQERTKAYVAANWANHTCKVVKVSQDPQGKQVSAVFEAFLDHPDGFRPIFYRALHALAAGAATFAEAMHDGEQD